MNLADTVQRVDTQLSHVWMVRTFLKHSDEAAEDEELAEIHRALYDYMLALGAPLQEGDAAEYVRVATKKFARLRQAAETFREIQPEVSAHMNFRMAAQSLTAAVAEISAALAAADPA
ncbi:MAG: amidohydrolase [Pirellulaceae bacterium]